MVGQSSDAPGERGPSWRYSNTGGASAAFRHCPTRKQGLQGLRFAPDGAGRWVEFRISAGLCGIAATWNVRTLVRTGFAGLHPAARKRPGTKTQCWCGFAADSLPGLQKSAHERFAHRLTHRTHLYVTLYTRARVRASGEVTTTCVRCVRSAGLWARASINWTPLATYQTTRYTLSPLSL